MIILVKYGKINIPKIREEESVLILCAQEYACKDDHWDLQNLAASHNFSMANQLQKEIGPFKLTPASIYGNEGDQQKSPLSKGWGYNIIG